MEKCPKCGYQRNKSDDIHPDYECPKCGIIYAKVNQRYKSVNKRLNTDSTNESAEKKQFNDKNIFVEKSKSKRNFVILIGLVICTILFSFMAYFKLGFLQSTLTKTTFADDYNFRKTKWGMSKSEVKATENRKPIYEDNSVFKYTGTILGMDAVTHYSFVNNALVFGSYNFNEKHENKNNYIVDYKNIQIKLTKKYGKAISNAFQWENEMFKDNPLKWGVALSMGHVSSVAEWKTKDTAILLGISGKNSKILLKIIYFDSITYQRLTKDEQLDDL